MTSITKEEFLNVYFDELYTECMLWFNKFTNCKVGDNIETYNLNMIMKITLLKL